MKKWMKYIFALLFALFLPTAVAAAENGKGILTAENNEVSVALNLPEGKTETITSLRLVLRVSAVSGAMEKPAFQFESAIKSAVQDADISQSADGSYLVDIILSGKKDQDVFKGSEYAKLGKLSIRPVGSEYEAKVEIADIWGDGSAPSVKYVDGSGVNEMTAPLADTAAVTVKNKPAPVDISDFGKKLKLKTRGKKGSRSIVFEWEKIESSDGYVLYEYDAKSKSYKEIKTINGAAVTAFSKKFKYASKHTFCLRAFKRAADGSKTYGQYSSEAKVTLAPAKVKGFSVKKTSKVKLSWKKVDGAKGYQIYAGTKKNGKYKLLKTIKKAKTTKLTIKKPKNGKTRYYKVRAYVTGNNGKKKYGEFSAVKK